MKDGLVIIPTYNEIENITDIVTAVLKLTNNFDVLVVDDNSPDGTADAVRSIQKEYPNTVFLENRIEKSGLGTAYIHGFKWALKRDYQYVCEMDADFSHDPNDLMRLYNQCHLAGADVAIGSRYKSGVNVVNWPMHRVLLSYFASKYVRFVTRMDINDTTAGFVCYKRIVLEKINLDTIKFVGYAFQIEMKFKAYVKKFKIDEVSVIFTDRTKGLSKMDGSIIAEAVFGVLIMKIKSIFNNEK